MAFRDPPMLKRLRNERAPKMTCAEFLAFILERAPTVTEAADDLGVSRQTVHMWRAMYEVPIAAE